MNYIRQLWLRYWPAKMWALGSAAALSSVLCYRLGLLPSGGLSPVELTVLRTPVGWHGIVNDPLNLPLQVGRSIGFLLDAHPGALTVRLPSAVIGGCAIAGFAWLVQAWHHWRIAILTTALFATSAWTLHVSRFASSDCLYLLVIPGLLVTRHVLHHQASQTRLLLILLFWGLLLYIPGVIWLVGLTIFWQRRILIIAWNKSSRQQQIGQGLAGVVWLPLLMYHFIKMPGDLSRWLGAPSKWNASDMVHRLIAVPYHLFVHAPAIPELWLGRLPLLDIFSLVMAAIGLLFYARNWRSGRSQQLLSYLLVSVLVVGIGGVAALSLAVPVLFLAIACGLDLLLRDWLRTFPVNPVARSFGIGLLVLAVSVASIYNLRQYFIAWPHAAITKQTFTEQP